MDTLGIIIKELRLQRGMSQKNLAKGICTQAQISKIEKGYVLPLTSTLHSLAERLGTNVNYILDLTIYKKLDYVIEVQSQMRQLVRKKKYGELYEQVQLEKASPLFQEVDKYRQFVIWHEGICEYHFNHNAKKALTVLQEALRITNVSEQVYSEREIEIVNSMGIIHFETGHYDEAITNYVIALKQFHNDNKPTDIRVRILYNLAKALTRKEQYEDSIEQCKKAIQLCMKNHLMYLLGELHYHIAYNFMLLTKCENALKYYESAISIFKLQGNLRYIEYIQLKMEEVTKP
ncbi:helix-turn-helix domain-containing protein [Alkalihalobacterium chitinilyticum]|uniref:Helix-turn-helix transcriptional regulator n=1 Tax=Alkalihalobacterium chitinilyticum TaxID=2980103 RepID=A0ABT5VH74_9BACI|nr:helix-turn-helix domain-containing protein [Alkalihalobacterium chitinilyticum]MDE5414798.1 helix-turn-helix transcriptional regulator [Alkalihalobacterium chitinilyticum]